jgi:hypothetical protein
MIPDELINLPDNPCNDRLDGLTDEEIEELEIAAWENTYQANKEESTNERN